MNKTTKIIAAFVIGAASGSVLGTLLVPDKRKELSKKLCESKKGTDKTRNNG